VILDLTYKSGSHTLNSDGIKTMVWNAYTNTNGNRANGDPNGPRTTETAYRFWGPMVMTDGEPVSCSSIGWN